MAQVQPVRGMMGLLAVLHVRVPNLTRLLCVTVLLMIGIVYSYVHQGLLGVLLFGGYLLLTLLYSIGVIWISLIIYVAGLRNEW